MKPWLEVMTSNLEIIWVIFWVVCINDFQMKSWFWIIVFTFLKSLNLLAIVIAIGIEIWKIKRLPLILYSTWVILFLHGLLRSNWLWRCTWEAKYIYATSSFCHAICIRSLLKELHIQQAKCTKIFVHNKSTLLHA